jgi:hypothetical protein
MAMVATFVKGSLVVAGEVVLVLNFVIKEVDGSICTASDIVAPVVVVKSPSDGRLEVEKNVDCVDCVLSLSARVVYEDEEDSRR